MGCIKSKRVHQPKKITKIQRVEELVVQPSIFRMTNVKQFQEVYQLGRLIGSGAYAEVRKCTHRENETMRAVKIFRKQHLDKAGSMKRILQEIQIIRTLDHPNIVRVFESFEDDKRYYVIMELCTGGELFEQLIKIQHFNESQAAQIMKYLFSAVAYLHEQNIIHRDLKPENILLEDSLNIKLVDFGSATYYERNSTVKGTQGTAYYVAPEVLSGSYTEKCDTWSCGVILYILLSGLPPFDGGNEEEILSKVEQGEYTFPPNLWGNISESAKDLIKSLLVPEPLRLSALEALEHPWIQEYAEQAQIESNAMHHILDNLKQFHSNNKLKDAVTTYIVTQCISAEDTLELREAFRKIDKNGDGKLSKGELVDVYSETMDHLQAEEEVNRIMIEVDTDHNGFIDYTEFIKASMDMRKMMSIHNLKMAFDLFDKDQSGSISASELKKVLEGGLDSSNKVWKDIVKEVDSNGDGEIDLHEFEDIVLRNI